MQSKKRWKTAVPATILTVSCLLFAGCGGNQASPANPASHDGGNSGTAANTEKMTINLMTQSYAGGGWPDNNNPVIQALDKKLNIDLKITWVPTNYSEKLNVLAASDAMPDVYTAPSQDFQKWVDKGVFMDVTQAYKSMPDLSKLPEEEMKISNPRGKYFGFPFYVNQVLDTLSIRQDWLVKLNLKMPDTLDDFYKVATAFAKDDPDGDGKDDTVGFSIAANVSGNTPFNQIDYISGAFGIANGWKDVNGKLVPWQTQTKELTDFVAFLRKAYSEGVLDKDFALLKGPDVLKKFEANKLGISFVNGSKVNEVTIPPLKKLAPNAQVVQMIPPAGPSGARVTATRTSGVDKVVINAKIDPKKQQRILEMLDYMISDEGYEIMRDGVENIDWKKTGDKYEELPAFDTDRPSILMGWFFKPYDPNFALHKWTNADDRKQMETFFNTSKKYVLENAGAGITSKTAVQLGSSLDGKLRAELIKIILGEDTIDKLAGAIDAWRSGGGDKIIAEMNEQYAKVRS